MLKKILVEFIGTFFLVFAVVVNASSNSQFAPFAIAATLCVCIYAGGRISGAHYNPAVSFSLFLRGLVSSKELVFYVLIQMLAAIFASLVGNLLIKIPFYPTPGDSYSMLQIIISELLFTFLLCLVVLNVAAEKSVPSNNYFGLAISLVVLAGAFSVGGISGAVFNPAVGVGPAILPAISGNVAHPFLTAYLITPLVGAAFAALVSKIIND